MKNQTFLVLALCTFLSISGQLFAQQATDGITKQRTKSNNTNEKSGLINPGVCTGKVRCADGSCIISFEQEIVSPRDAASGLSTGKRMHKPFVMTKELDKVQKETGSGLANGKVSMSDLSIMITIQGRSRKLQIINNEFTLPADCPNGDCDLIASWSWGATNSSSAARCEVPFKLNMQDGEYHAINTKGTGGTR
jgi:hypothetical protein